MTIRKRGKQAAGEMIAETEATGDQPGTEAGISEPLTDPVPGDLAAAAAELRQAAIDADEQAVRCRAEAETVRSVSQAEADRIIREGHAKALPLIADATALERKAIADGGRSKHLEHAARRETLAEEAEHQADELTAELGHLTEVITGLDGRLAELGADQERLEAEDAAACSAGNVPASADLEPLIKATGKAITALTAQRETAQALARPDRRRDRNRAGPAARRPHRRLVAPCGPHGGTRRALPRSSWR